MSRDDRCSVIGEFYLMAILNLSLTIENDCDFYAEVQTYGCSHLLVLKVSYLQTTLTSGRFNTL